MPRCTSQLRTLNGEARKSVSCVYHLIPMSVSGGEVALITIITQMNDQKSALRCPTEGTSSWGLMREYGMHCRPKLAEKAWYKALVKRIQHFTEQRRTLLCLALCCSAQGGQTNTTFRPTFLEFRDLCDVNRKPAFVFKLFLGVRFRNCVKLSMREWNKLDRVVKRIRHCIEQRTATLKTKEMFDCSANIFDRHQTT